MRPSKSPTLFQRVKTALAQSLGSQQKREAIVVCPAVQLPARVELLEDRVLACSRLTGTDQCSADCSPQLRYAKQDLANFLAANAGKNCGLCGKPIEAEDWYSSRLSKQSTPAKADVVQLAAEEVQVCHRCHQSQ